jgi:hypothetical protein
MGEWRYNSTDLDLALDGGEWSASRPCRFTPGEITPCNHCIGGWVGPKAGLDAVKKRKILPLLGIETLAVQPVAIPTELSWLKVIQTFQKIFWTLIDAVTSFDTCTDPPPPCVYTADSTGVNKYWLISPVRQKLHSPDICPQDKPRMQSQPYTHIARLPPLSVASDVFF